jgi:hypothetical protein
MSPPSRRFASRRLPLNQYQWNYHFLLPQTRMSSQMTSWLALFIPKPKHLFACCNRHIIPQEALGALVVPKYRYGLPSA